MLSRVSSPELVEWAAFYKIENEDAEESFAASQRQDSDPAADDPVQQAIAAQRAQEIEEYY